MMGVLLIIVATGSAQMTAESIMALMPALPTESEMIRFQKEKNAPTFMGISITQENLYVDFLEKLEDAQDQAQNGLKINAEDMKAKAMGSKVEDTGYTAGQIVGMSESQLEAMAQSHVAKKLSGLGLSMSEIEKMGDGDISEAQAMALAQKIAANQKGNAKAGGGQQQKMQKLNLQLHACGERELALNQEIQSKTKQALKDGRALYDRDFKARVKTCEATIKEAISEGALEEKYSEEQEAAVKAAEKKFQEALKKKWEIECEFYAQFIPMWRNAILSAMDLCKTKLLSLKNEQKQIYDEMYALTQRVDYALGDIYPPQAGLMYLEIPEDIEQYETVLEGIETEEEE